MKNPHKQFPGKMDAIKKKTFKKGYKTLAKGNVKEGYGKMKHVKMFENFDTVTEASDIDALVLKSYYHLTDEERKKVDALSDEEAEAIKLANGYKWFLAQEGSEKFKFLAKDKEDAEGEAATWNAVILGEVDEDMEFEDTPMDKEVNEGSYTDFLTSNGNEIKAAVKKMQEIAEVYDDKIESVSDELDKALEPYDEDVANKIDSWTSGDISTDKIATFAIENQDKHGTEPIMVLDAIDAFHKIMTK